MSQNSEDIKQLTGPLRGSQSRAKGGAKKGTKKTAARKTTGRKTTSKKTTAAKKKKTGTRSRK
jgi:topoisomerase IA-like protein